MNITMDEIKHALRRGSGFENGKYRIMQMYERETDERELAKLLAKEYGIGGHSHTYLDGESGFVDYDGRGIRMTRKGFSEVFENIAWAKATRIIRWMIDNNDYLNDQERERYAAWKAEHLPASSVPAAEPAASDPQDDDAPDYEQLTFADLMGGF